MLLSIGHSNLSWESFSDLVRAHDLNVIIDVRSYPRSRFAQFNRSTLRLRLNDMGTSYIFAGDRLGGLSAAKQGYEVTTRSPIFCDALNDVIAVERRCRAALMCSECDPLHCHRFLLVSRALSARGLAVAHILRDGAIEDHAEAEERMRRSLKLKQNLLIDRSGATSEAYRLQTLKIGARP